MGDVRPNQLPLVAPGEIDCHARDMTATFSADVTLRDAQRRLAELDQWLPIDGNADATLGHLISTNSTGPLRLGYGAWRDLLLGAQFLNGAGELITAGGRTVKNVAGYDLTKFMVGQRGVFATLVTVTTRTYKRPQAALRARFTPASDQLISRLMPTTARPQWAMLSPESLLCGYLGDESTIAFYESVLPQHVPIELARRSVEDDIAERAALWRCAPASSGRCARAAVPPTRILEFAKNANLNQWIADAAFGIVLCDSSEPGETQLRSAARNVGGSAFVHSADDMSCVDVSANAVERRIIELLKHAFDPDGKLAPIRWQTTP